MAEPSIFILGVQKCGTTTVADLLAAQPEIFLPSIKETYFFCDESRYAKGDDWYRSEFYARGATQGSTRFCDATPFYLASREALERIERYAGDEGRFVVCLRDPVQRAYSAYWHQRRLGNETLPFAEALAAEPLRIAEGRAAKGRWWRHAYVEVGMYGKHLEHAFQVLGRERFLVLNETDLADMQALQARLRAFLGLPECQDVPNVKRSNSSAMPRSRWVQAAIIRNSALKRVIQAVLPREFRSRIGRTIREINQRAFRYPPMEEETRIALRQTFSQDRTRLRSLKIPVPESWQANG